MKGELRRARKLVERARELYRDRQDNGAHWTSGERANFRRRVRRLAKQVEKDKGIQFEAVMYLDAIALREGIWISYSEDI